MRDARSTTIAFLALVLLAGRGAAQSPEFDVIHLNNGSEFHGRVIREDEQSVTVLFRGGEIVLERRRIKSIARGERIEVEKTARLQANLSRFQDREEFSYVYYRGKRKGWRSSSVRGAERDGVLGYLFESRTVFLADDGKPDLDLRLKEFVDQEMTPRFVSVSELGEFSRHSEGVLADGHLRLERSGNLGAGEAEILFAEGTELITCLSRRLADQTYFPDEGQTFKVYDGLSGQFRRVHATRDLRKEIVGGKHQYVTVWKLQSGDRTSEMWIDGYGGVVREELFGRSHMVAIRAEPKSVLAYARGEDTGEDGDLSLAYDNVPDGFGLVRPNLTWSFEFPDPEESLAITLLNPTLQASVDVMVLDRIERDTAPETVVMDLVERMKSRSKEQSILYQRSESVGGGGGLRFEIEGERKGVDLRTIGAVTMSGDKAYALLLAAPKWRFHEAAPHLEKILASFELKSPEAPRAVD